MISIVVNGAGAKEIPKELRPYIAEIVGNYTLTPFQKHEEICGLLSVCRFMPSPVHKPYALRASLIQLYDTSRCVATFGSWHECYNCHTNIDNKPQGQTCPTCGKNTMPNFKADEQIKKVPSLRTKYGN